MEGSAASRRRYSFTAFFDYHTLANNASDAIEGAYYAYELMLRDRWRDSLRIFKPMQARETPLRVKVMRDAIYYCEAH